MLVLIHSCWISILSQQERDENQLYSNLVFLNERKGLLLLNTTKESFILITDDGGTNWRKSFSVKAGLLDLEFIDELNGWAVGSNGTILHSNDAGETWSIQRPPTNALLYAVSTTDWGDLWAVGANGTILRSRDFGNTWEITNFTKRIALVDVKFFNESRGYITGFETILETTDGGKNWAEQKSDEWKHLGKILTLDSNGWILARTVLLPIRNKCVELNRKVVMGQGVITDGFFVDRSDGWLIRTRERADQPISKIRELVSEGTVLRSRDGGATWTEVSVFASYSSYSYSLTSVYFIDNRKGWILGKSGTILTTDDGGINWSESRIHIRQ